MAKMTESQLLAIVDNELKRSLGGTGGKLAAAREEAMKYYLGEASGKLSPSEIDGSSTVVSRDVADTIEWAMPSLMRIFTGGDEAVVYEPQGMEDEAYAEQMTDWANYVFYKQNQGFLVLHNWLKDALLQKLGVLKVWWDKRTDEATESYNGLSLEELVMMLQEGETEVIEQEQREDGLINVKLKKATDCSQICIEGVPPEEFLFSRDARSPDNIYSCHHRVKRTVSELRQMGYKNVDTLMDDDSEAEFSSESVERREDIDEWGARDDANLDETMRFVWITESYLKTDWNGDGVAEWRKVVKCGKVLLENEEVDGHPFCVITPILMPHRLVGRSLADMVLDLQEIKTALMRQMLDNIYLQNNPRQYVDETKSVNIDDLLDSRVGGIVRGRGENGVTPLVTQPLSPHNFTLLEYVDSVKENRTGITKYNQGLDANSLNKTATGINAIMNAAQQRIELVARICAETGIKNLFVMIQKLSAQYSEKAKVIRLRNKYVNIDPRAWRTKYDVTVNVGLGTGNKDQIAMHLMNILQVQKEAMMGGLPIVNAKKIYNTSKRLAENLGFKDGDMFFMDPEGQEAQQEMAMKAQQPNPEMQKLQMEGQAKQAELQMKQAEVQGNMELQKYKIDTEAQLALVKHQTDAELTNRKHEMDAEARKTPQTQISLPDYMNDTQAGVQEAIAAMVQTAAMTNDSIQMLAGVMSENTQAVLQSNQALAQAMVQPETVTMTAPSGKTYTAVKQKVIN